MEAPHPGRDLARSLAGVTVAALAAGILATLTVAVIVDGGPMRGELRLVQWWQAVGEPVPTLAELVGTTTSTEACIVASLPAVWWLARRYGRRAAPAIVIALCSMLVVQPVTKVLIDRPRPTAEQVDVRAEHTSTSFPSGHSLSTTATWGAAALYGWRSRRARWAPLLAIPIAATGVSSWIQGVHWPSDAAAGTIIGAFAAWWVVRVLPGERPRVALRSTHRRD